MDMTMFLQLVRYSVIALGVHWGLTAEMQEALVGLSIAFGTALWGLNVTGKLDGIKAKFWALFSKDK